MIGLLKKALDRLIPYRGSVYQRIGGQRVVSQLVDDFYHVMQTDSLAQRCLATHEGRDLKVAGEKLKAFLSGWLGGPQLYLEKYGHPRLRMRHFPFSIGEEEASEWIYCMEMALKKSKIKKEEQEEMLNALRGVTQLIKNRD
jgi:hemoglobin